MKLEPNEGQAPTFLDNSGYCEHSRCPAKYAFRSVLGFDTTDPKPPLDYGTAIHEAMPHLQRHDLERAIEAFRVSWLESGNVESDTRSVLNGVRSITDWYETRVKRDPDSIPYAIIEPPSSNIEPAEAYSDQEFAFSVDLGGTLPFCGRCDAIARNDLDNKLWLVEYKTSSEIGSRVLNSFDLNSQCIGYAAAASIMCDETVEGVFLEIIRTSKTNPQSVLLPIPIHPHTIDGFIEDFKRESELIMTNWENKSFPNRFASCAPYCQHGSHGYQCKFAFMCKCPDWRVMREAFIVSYWKPFKELT